MYRIDKLIPCCHLPPIVNMSEPQEANEGVQKTDEQTEVHPVPEVTAGSTDDKEKELRAMFDAIDADKDGRLSLGELVTWYRSAGLNPTQETVQNLLDECDANGSKYIEFDEYKDKLKSRMDEAVGERDSLMDAFRAFDKKGDGTISYLMLRTVLSGAGDALDDAFLDEIFRDMDVNKDGVITYKDMVGKICKT